MVEVAGCREGSDVAGVETPVGFDTGWLDEISAAVGIVAEEIRLRRLNPVVTARVLLFVVAVEELADGELGSDVKATGAVVAAGAVMALDWVTANWFPNVGRTELCVAVTCATDAGITTACVTAACITGA